MQKLILNHHIVIACHPSTRVLDKGTFRIQLFSFCKLPTLEGWISPLCGLSARNCKRKQETFACIAKITRTDFLAHVLVSFNLVSHSHYVEATAFLSAPEYWTVKKPLTETQHEAHKKLGLISFKSLFGVAVEFFKKESEEKINKILTDLKGYVGTKRKPEYFTKTTLKDQFLLDEDEKKK